MALNRLLSAALLAALLGGSAWLAQDARASFADAAGFSGRGGATCVACHTEAPFPLAPPAATAVLEGPPADGWDAGQAYTFTIRVEGGPAAMPAPAPQGGFDIAVAGGSFAVPADFTGLIRLPHAQEATYFPEGTLMREWQVEWTAPTLAQQPRPVDVWLAVLAANGNHVIAANASDGGERLDASAHLRMQLAPSAATQQAWRAMPLAAPTATAEVVGDMRTVVTGRHADGNATHIAWRLDGGPWTEREAGPEWRVRLDGLAAGEHRFEVRSLGADRASPEASVAFEVPGLVDLPGGKDTPAASAPLLLLGMLACAVFLLRLRSHR